MSKSKLMGALRRVSTFACGALLLVAAAPAQNGNPTEEIKELARQIDEQLQEIDRLLLESGRNNQQRQKPREMLKEAAEKSLTVQDGIDKLIEKLNEMKDQSSSSSSSSSGEQSEQDPSQGQPQNGKPGQRRENQTPDFVQQPQQGEQQGQQPQGEQEGQQQQGQQQGEQQQQQQQGEQQGQQPQPNNGQPTDGQEQRSDGQNRNGQLPPDELGPGQPGTGEKQWGELQPYTNFLKNRGVTPKVADKYRKYYEAYLKQKQKGGK